MTNLNAHILFYPCISQLPVNRSRKASFSPRGHLMGNMLHAVIGRSLTPNAENQLPIKVRECRGLNQAWR